MMDECSQSSTGSSIYTVGTVGSVGTVRKKESSVIAGRENKAVQSVRLFAIFGLFCAIPLAIVVFIYTNDAEKDEFDFQYNEYANKVLEAIGSSLENTFGAIDNLAVGMVATAQALNQTWPNILIPDFGIQAAKTLSLSKAKVLVSIPLVTDATRVLYENFTVQAGPAWVEETLDLLETDGNFYGPITRDFIVDNTIHDSVGDLDYSYDSSKDRIYLPSWQAYPIVPEWAPYNWNYLSLSYTTTAHTAMLETNTIVMTNPYLNPDLDDPEQPTADDFGNAAWLGDRSRPYEEHMAPASDMFFPIRGNVDSIAFDPNEAPRPVGAFAVTFYWRDMIRDILPSSARGILVVTENPCSAAFTYRLDGGEPTLVGHGDRHDTKYDDMVIESLISELDSFRLHSSTYSGPKLNVDLCPITFKVYPSKDTKNQYQTNAPYFYAAGAVGVCLVAAMIFLIYDRYVERRQRAVMASAEKTNAVVSSLFPASIRAKLFQSQVANNSLGKGDDEATKPQNAAPIAELYTDTTVFFADIAGFTAWSSSREPSDVFLLLEAIYSAFDKMARQRKVFKVETIGDCYVAVCGLPEPNKLHAVVMARFAANCRAAMKRLVKGLATRLGPDTENLRMRYGLNSGPTTAGVLRGDRARFQLFGDTANTAARMQSTSLPNLIQASRKTADLLMNAGKTTWIRQRKDPVDAKGKGIMITYWVEPGRSQEYADLEQTSTEVSGYDDLRPVKSLDWDRIQSLIDWNVEVLEKLLIDLVGSNLSRPSHDKGQSGGRAVSSDHGFTSSTPRQEIVEVITIPNISGRRRSMTMKKVRLPPEVQYQLRLFVSCLARLHTNTNPFHNFDHASHVAMSVRKLVSRILKPLKNKPSSIQNKADILRSTYVLTSDPMIQFAMVVAALIHDVDHPGVPNGTLVNEKDERAIAYGDKSVAEQNSVVVFWEHLMSKQFDDLRVCMFADESQLQRFRQLIVNAVMATDIFDKELKEFRERRWAKAFPGDSLDGCSVGTPGECSVDLEGELRATIVIEHIIQASDVVHTMQHWTVYQKWNRRLFEEMRASYKAGRSDNDPATGWYRGEIWFFDNYIIPLAKKLKECGVFGVSCDEVLDYARDNRMEWEQKGEALVARWVEEAQAAAAEAEAATSKHLVVPNYVTR